MKKVILSMVLTLAASVAMATDTVKVYGVVDAGVSKETGSTTKLESGIKSGSFIGVKGSEKLDRDTKVFFVLENGFDLDTGTTSKTGLRQSYIGISDDTYGSVKLGRQFSPIYDTLKSLDPMAVNLAGNIGKQLPYEKSTSNTVSYTAPTLVKGVSATVAYSFAEDSKRQVGLATSYTDGPLTASIAYANVDNVSHQTVYGATYDFTSFKGHALYANVRSPLTDSRDYMLGASVPTGSGVVSASVVRKFEYIKTGLGQTQVALAYVHPLSKRTSLYTSASHTYKQGKIRDTNAVNAGINVLF